LPTSVQAIQAAILCQWLSNAFQPINIFRYDAKFKTIYIQAGVTNELAIVINEKGEWEFI